MNTETAQIISQQDLLRHWQGHRTLTRKVIEAFPEKELFEFSIGGMRTFAKLVTELIAIGGPALKAIVSNESKPYDEEATVFTTKEQILKKWDEETAVIDTHFNLIPAEQFSKNFDLFGEYNFPIIENVLYFIDNEVHHRGQGYVYLRALGIEPPMFWDR